MTSPATILLVEDSANDRELTEIALRESQLVNRIDYARDGQEAVEYFADHARPLPTLVLLDLNLPRIAGLEVLRRLREGERTKLLPIVVLTSSNRESDRVRSYSSGANAYVCKPVEFGGFAKAVQALGLFWLVVNEPPPEPRQQPL